MFSVSFVEVFFFLFNVSVIQLKVTNVEERRFLLPHFLVHSVLSSNPECRIALHYRGLTGNFLQVKAEFSVLVLLKTAINQR